MRFLAVLAFLIVPAWAEEPSETPMARHILTNESIVTLAKAGFDELFIVERIRTSRTHFDTSVDGLVALKKAGITEDLIRVMAIQDMRRFPAPIEAVPAGGAAPTPVHKGRGWFGFHWSRETTSPLQSAPAQHEPVAEPARK